MSLVPRPASLWLALALSVVVAGCSRENTENANAADPAGSPAAPATAALLPLPSAKERIAGVMDRFLAAQSYHVTMTTSGPRGDGTMEMDFVAPDRYRLKTPMGTQLVIGDTMYMTMNGRTMTMALPKGQVGEYRDPARLAEHRATMSVEALGSEAIDGKPADKFRLRNTQPEPVESTMWVGADGYPLQIEVSGNAGGQTSRTLIRYSRFNDPAIRVDPPQGGS